MTATDNIPRNFLLRTYPTMKKHNPHTPILIREAANTAPKVWARYGAFSRFYTVPRVMICKVWANMTGIEHGKELMLQLNGRSFHQDHGMVYGMFELTFVTGLDEKTIESQVKELVQPVS